MFTLKRELCSAVIETHLLPRTVCMTVHAFIAQLAFVRVVLLVARVALRRRIPIPESRRVTVLTLDLSASVGTAQSIVR